MTDSFAVDLASGPYFQLPKYFVGGKMVNFSAEIIAYDLLQGSTAPRTSPGGKSVQSMLRAALPDFLSWSTIQAAPYDGYNGTDVNQAQWKALLDAGLIIVGDGGAIAPGFIAHGTNAPTVMGNYPSPPNTPELLTSIAPSANAYSKEQAGKWLVNTILPACGGDVSKIVGVEVSNEPATNNPQQYGNPGQPGDWPSGQGWYNDPGTIGSLEEDFHTNIFKIYADYFTSLIPGIKVQGYSYSYGARASSSELQSLQKFVNAYTGSRPDQLQAGGKNLSAIGLLALHGYTQISTGGIAGANVNDPQQAWNTIFHTTVPYDITKDGFVGGVREKRTLFNTLGGQSVSLHFSEQWLIAGSGATQNSIQAMADVVGFIATVQNAQSWFPNGGGYTVANVNASIMPGAFDSTTSWPSANDFMFGYQSNNFQLHYTGRYSVFKDMLCGFGNRNGYQRLLPVTQTSATSPVTVVGNGVPRIQGVAGLNAAGTKFAMLVVNVDMTNPSTSCAFSWTGSAATGNVTGLKWAGNGSLPLDSDCSATGTLATAGANSFALTLAAGDCVIITVPVSSTAGGTVPTNLTLPTVSGALIQGSVLTGGDGTWTNTPTGVTRQWYRCDPNGANPAAIGSATGSMYTTVSGDVGSTIRFGVIETNASGASALTYSSPTGVIQSSGGGTSTPTPSGTAVVLPIFANADSRNITCPTMTSGIMLFHFHGKSVGDSLSSLSFNGVSLTKLLSQTDGGASIFTEVWYLLAPPAGTHTLLWSKTGNAQNLGYSVQWFDGVDQTHPFGVTPAFESSGFPSGQTLTDTVPAGTNDAVIAAATFNIAAGIPTHGSGQTALYATNESTTQMAASYKIVSQAGNVSLSESASQAAANGAQIVYLLHGNATGAPPVNNSAPVVTGSPVELQLLTSSTGSWNDPTSTFTYKWQSSDPVTISWSDIGAATSSTFSLTVSQDGKIVRSVVMATNSFGTSSGVPSQATATITSPGAATAPTNTVAPVASGPVTVGSTETCDTGTYQASHPPTTFTYEWRRV